jgi:nitrous oxidase accessory protein
VGENYPVIDSEYGDEIFTVFADSTTIKGFHLQNIGVSYLKEQSGIRLGENQGWVVENNRLTDTFFGIYLKKVKNTLIRNNEVRGSLEEKSDPGNGIHLWQCREITIENNFVSGHRDGIYFEFVNQSKILGNKSMDNQRYGLHFMFSNDDVYEENVFQSNGAGVAVMFSQHIIMHRNAFVKNWGGAAYGILLKEISHGEMTYNTFDENTKAIYAEGASDLHIKNNDFIANGWAIDIKGNSIDNEIVENNFINNTFDVVTNSKRNPNLFLHNYWSKHPGYDLNRDGYADVPYRPVSLLSMIVVKIPAATMLLHSMLASVFDYAEKVIPSLIPAALIDDAPAFRPIQHDTYRETE